LHINKPVESILSTLDLATLDTPATVITLHWAVTMMMARYAVDPVPDEEAPTDAADAPLV
jgi:hypothetical protein